MKLFNKKGKNEKNFDEVTSQIMKEHDEAVAAFNETINMVDEDGETITIADMTKKAKQLIAEQAAWMDGYKVGMMTGTGAGVVLTLIGATTLKMLKK